MSAPEKEPQEVGGQNIATTGIPENPWVDDVAMLKDTKAHFAVDRLATCACEACAARAQTKLGATFEKAFGKPMAVTTGEAIFTRYKDVIQKMRVAKRGLSPLPNTAEIFMMPPPKMQK